MLRLLNADIDYDWSEEYGWLSIYPNFAEESNAAFAVTDDGIMLVVESGLDAF